jgi:hypothetical protein
MISAGQWYSVILPASECGMHGKAKTMQDAFEALFQINGAPNSAALFTSHDEHFKKYYFYFSPRAAQIARSLVDEYSGVPCAAPIVEENTPVLLVGHSHAREALLGSAE